MMMTVRANGTTLASEFSCLILDSASIHKDEDFILKMKTHIHVMFIPPYCYHLSPLDFGAYGLVERFLRKMGEDFGEHNIEDSLAHALESVTDEQAKWCFHNCRYLF